MHSTTVMTGRSTAREGVELLKEILASVDEVAAAYVAWNAASPGWTYGPQLAWEKGQWVPTWAALARTQVPLLSEKPVSWTAAPLAGLSAFRHAVQAEIQFLEQAHAQPGNTPYLCAFWQELLHALAYTSPIVALNTTVSAHIQGPRVKVQLVSGQGTCWTRIVPIRLDALLHECRAFDASREPGEVSSYDDFIADNALVSIAQDLKRASDDSIEIHLVLPRLALAPDVPPAPPVGSNDYWEAPDTVRVHWRLAAIVARVQESGIHVRMGAHPDPIQVSAQIPRPTPLKVWHPTATLNLDVSALVALCSDITHGMATDLHGHANRALASQAAHEQQHPLLPWLAEYLHEPTQLVASAQVLEKFAAIVESVASSSERARAQWLIGPRSTVCPPWLHLPQWERLFPEPVRRVSSDVSSPDEEMSYVDACLSALTQIRACQRSKSLGQSAHTWHALQWGLQSRTTTLLAHAYGVQELTEKAGPPPSLLSSDALLWLMQPRSFVSNSQRRILPNTPVMRQRSDSSSSVTACLSERTQSQHSGSRMTWRRAWDWIQGPLVPQAGLLPFPRWWPFTPLETYWLNLTARVAWAEPPPIALPGSPREECIDLEEVGQDTLSDTGLPRIMPIIEGQTRVARSKGFVLPGQAWWHQISRDVCHNALHWTLLVATCISWLFAFAVLVDNAWFSAQVKTSHGWETPVPSSCTTTFWSRNAECGLNGAACAPFSDARYTFQCPRGCEKTTLLNPRQVGDKAYNYMPLIVGGKDGTPYRGDSFLCAAAQHAGVIGQRGGCGLLRLVGTFGPFTPIVQHGLESVPFQAEFPQSFVFEPVLDQKNCTDERWKMYVLDAVLTAFVTLVLRPMPIFLLFVCPSLTHQLAFVYCWILACQFGVRAS